MNPPLLEILLGWKHGKKPTSYDNLGTSFRTKLMQTLSTNECYYLSWVWKEGVLKPPGRMYLKMAKHLLFLLGYYLNIFMFRV
jgi:hypothetical protein